jgi:2,4-dienoyl-CoA reductase-like NADH-dependent reductase (Old Yellow Enzyme family)
LTLSTENYGFLNELPFAIKQNGAIASIELNHSGSHANPPHRSPVGPVSYVRPDGVRVEAADIDMINRIVDKFAQAALTAKNVGFDGVVIHGAHGWLLGEFLSPLTNRRTDQFGGSLENRARLPMLIVDAVRKAVGPDFLIEYRVSGSELVAGGLAIEESTAFIRMIRDKINLVNVSAGLDHIPEVQIHVQPTHFLPHGYHVKWAEHMKKELDIPVIALGGITTPELAERILADGKADFIGMSRPLLADPQLPNKAREGRPEDITPCVRCMNCLADASLKKVVSCSVNPRLGRELRLNGEYAKKPKAKKVLVIGGGFAGMKAASTAAERGHSVILAEMTNRLGGILKFSDHDELKKDIRLLKNHLIAQVEKTGVRVELNKFLTKRDIAAYEADAILVAVGSTPKVPPIPGIGLRNVWHVSEFFDKKLSPEESRHHRRRSRGMRNRRGIGAQGLQRRRPRIAQGLRARRQPPDRERPASNRVTA